MPAPYSRGLSQFAPIVNRQGLSASMSMPRPMARPMPQRAPQPQRPTQTFARPRPGAMAMPPQASNPFAGFQQPAAQLPPQPFNPNPNPTAGAGAGQMPLGKQMAPQFNPGMLPQVEPYDPSQIKQPNLIPQLGSTPQNPMYMNATPSTMPGQNFSYPTGQNPALNPDIMFAPVPQQGATPSKFDQQMFGVDADGVVGTGRPVGGGSLFNPGAFKMK